MREALDRHKNIAMHLSGGKDSVACLYLMRPYLDRITVYHLDTGDEPPETHAVLRECLKIIPHYVNVATDVRGWTAKNGYPSDVVPTGSSHLGRLMGFGDIALSDRFSCCWNNIMFPMHERMKADEITLIIRGQKLVDMPKVPMHSGESFDGIEVLYPIEHWTHADVMTYLREVGAPVSDVYSVLPEDIGCMHCTAWWDKKSIHWLKKSHPEAHDFVVRKYAEIKNAVRIQMDGL